MLVLSRKQFESIVVGGNVTISVAEIRGDKVRLAIDAPADVAIHRKEVWLRIQAEGEADGDSQAERDAA